MNIHIVCRVTGTRILARLYSILNKYLGWSVSSYPAKGCLNYAFPYFELRDFNDRFIALFTHREDTNPEKVKIWYRQAEKASIRLVFCELYRKDLERFGKTYIVTPPLDRDLFRIYKKRKNEKPVIGVSGFVYSDGRKGEKLLSALLKEDIAKEFEWKACGRGWPVETKMYEYQKLPEFYNSLDIYLCTATIEGVPYPPLEAMACGIRCIIPEGVGILDELPDLPDLIRYEKGNLDSLKKALEKALTLGETDREELRKATEKFTNEAWIDDHLKALSDLEKRKSYWLFDKRKESNKGICTVAYGKPARDCAVRLINSVREHNPDIPVCLCSDKELGIEDYFCYFPDLDLGGRQAKINSFWSSPNEWEYVIYLDSDVVLCESINFLFYCLEQGWDIVITKDTNIFGNHLIGKLFSRDKDEEREGLKKLKTGNLLALAGGVFGFRKNKKVEKFFKDWKKEWGILARRDQGALLRALVKNPLKAYVLSNHWNNLVLTRKSVEDDYAIIHYPMQARRWRGNYPTRLDNGKLLAVYNPIEIDSEDNFYEMLALKSFINYTIYIKRNSIFLAVGGLAKKLKDLNLAVATRKSFR